VSTPTTRGGSSGEADPGPPVTPQWRQHRIAVPTPTGRRGTLARGGQPDEAEEEMRAATLEPVTPGDFPATLVARLARVQGLIALARGDRELAERRLEEAAAGWRRHASPALDGEAYLANLVDFGRIALVGLVEPVYELRRVESELEELRATVA